MAGLDSYDWEVAVFLTVFLADWSVLVLAEIIPMRCHKGAGFVSIVNEVFKLEGGCLLFIATSTA